MIALTPARRAVLERRLTDAEESYHQLMTGTQAVVFVDQNGERIEYNKATASFLLKYIAELKRELGLLNGSGPLNIWM